MAEATIAERRGRIVAAEAATAMASLRQLPLEGAGSGSDWRSRSHMGSAPMTPSIWRLRRSADCRSPPSTGSWPAQRGRKGSGSWGRLRRDPNDGFGEGRIPSGSGIWGAERGDMMTVAGPVGWRAGAALNLPDRAWRGGAGPGTGGVSVTTYNGERIWDRKADGGFPDAKTLKQRVPNHPGRDLGPIDRAAAGKKPE